MRVGLLYEGIGGDEDFGAVVEQVVEADRLGFDAVWVEERHFEDGGVGSPAICLAALSQVTRTVRLGAFTTLALAHPVRVAEDFAMVDLFSGGRLDFGVCAGSSADEFRRYRASFIERAGRCGEALDIVLAAWSFDEFAYGGHHFCVPAHAAPGAGLVRKRFGQAGYVPQWERGPDSPDHLTVTPKPLQQPHPPVWVQAGEPAWVTFAAERGYSVVLAGAEARELERAAAAYETTLARAGRARSEAQLAVVTDVATEGGRVAPGAVAELHRLHGATGMNQVIWRLPHPALAQADLLRALRHFAGEVQPLLQA